MSPLPGDLPPPSIPPARRSLNTSVVLVLSFGFVAAVFLPLWKPLLLAMVFAAAVSRFHNRLSRRLGDRRYLAAGVFALLLVIMILAPLSVLGVVAVRSATVGIAWVMDVLRERDVGRFLDPLPAGLAEALRPALEQLLRSFTRLPAGSVQAGTWAASQLQHLLATISDIAFELVMMILAYFFLLTEGNHLAAWLKGVSPLGRSRTQELFDEFRVVSRSLIGSNLITGVAQSVVATIGYVVAGAPSPLFFGTLTFMTSFIPSVGTAIVVLPLAGLLALGDRPWSALFLACWGLFLVSLVDNMLRPILLKADVHIHGALLFFALIGGIMLFGLAGLVVGPMALSIFLTLMRFHARDLRQETGAVPLPFEGTDRAG